MLIINKTKALIVGLIIAVVASVTIAPMINTAEAAPSEATSQGCTQYNAQAIVKGTSGPAIRIYGTTKFDYKSGDRVWVGLWYGWRIAPAYGMAPPAPGGNNIDIGLSTWWTIRNIGWQSMAYRAVVC